MDLNPDFFDMVAALREEGAELLVVGAFAMAAHGVPRATGDLDLWVRPEPENATRVWRALLRFGAPVESAGLTIEDLANPDMVFQMGQPPRRIDVITGIDGVTFDEAWPNRKLVTVEGLEVPCLGRRELIRNKEASGRDKDLVDLKTLREQDVGE
ncbi:MAG TPA: hypothetical protein VLF66_03230 [Thermoanaerobaculia bacterium]|nr:hypothetical protein [Thermoanaerobaculia bacterium]